MSYRIELAQVAVLIPKEIITAFPDYEDKYLLLSLGGDNNLIDNYTNRFSRAWSIEAVGNKHQCMCKVIKMAVDCEGGSLKGLRGDMLPETYIKKWRDAIKQPISLDQYFTCFTKTIKVAFNAIDSESKCRTGELINDLKDKYSFEHKPHWYYKDRMEYIFKMDFKNNDALNDILSLDTSILYVHFISCQDDQNHNTLNLVNNYLSMNTSDVKTVA